MRDYSKTGSKKGRPAYMTPSSFIKKTAKLRYAARLEGKVKNVGIKSVRKKKK